MPVGALWMHRNLASLIKESPVVMPTDVLGSTGAGRVAHEGLVAISPQGPCFFFRAPVAGHAAGCPLIGVEVRFRSLLICPPEVVCSQPQFLWLVTC